MRLLSRCSAALVVSLLPACATQSVAPAADPSPPPAAVVAVTPPPLAQPAVAGAPQTPQGAQQELRRSILRAAWPLVRDKPYDKALGGLDWAAMRDKYEPLAIGAPDEPTFYRFVNQMLGELGQSHLEVTGP